MIATSTNRKYQSQISTTTPASQIATITKIENTIVDIDHHRNRKTPSQISGVAIP